MTNPHTAPPDPAPGDHDPPGGPKTFARRRAAATTDPRPAAVPVVAGAVRLVSVAAGRCDGLFDVRFVVNCRGADRPFGGPFRPTTLVDFGRFRRIALRNHRVLIRHAGAEAGRAAGRRAWADEVQRATDAGAVTIAATDSGRAPDDGGV